jgi:hypothetical protein
VAFIAETVAELLKLAKAHRLEVLSHLLGMVQLEAEERMRTRRKSCRDVAALGEPSSPQNGSAVAAGGNSRGTFSEPNPSW